jgi:CO/xanthine dehydrogenase FAD-binding subunit
VSVAAHITQKNGVCEDARIVLGSVAPVPVRAREAEQAIIGRAVDEASTEAAAQLAAVDPLPLAKNGYKVDLARALTKRAIRSSAKG